MDDATYQRWWQLHLRTSRGEVLGEHERINYEGGLRELHGQELLTDEHGSNTDDACPEAK